MPAAQAFPAAAWKWFFCFAAEGQREGPVPGQPRQEEVRVPRPLAKDTWAATHAGVHLDIGGDPPTLVRSTAHACSAISDVHSVKCSSIVAGTREHVHFEKEWGTREVL